MLPGLLAPPAHHVEELAIGLGGAHLLEYHFHGLYFIHVVQELAQNAGLLQNLRLQQQLFTACAAAVELDGWEYALFVQTAIQVNLGVSGSLEFLKNNFVHAAAGIDQRRCDDGE